MTLSAHFSFSVASLLASVSLFMFLELLFGVERGVFGLHPLLGLLPFVLLLLLVQLSFPPFIFFFSLAI